MALSRTEEEMIKEIMSNFDRLWFEIREKYQEKMQPHQMVHGLAACHLGAVPRILVPLMGREIAVAVLMKAAQRELDMWKKETKAAAH